MSTPPDTVSAVESPDEEDIYYPPAFHKVAQEIDSLPDYVRDATPENPPANLPTNAFADPHRRRYPAHTKAATWLSAIELYSDQAEPDKDIEGRLIKLATAHGVLEDVREVQAVFSGMLKMAGVEVGGQRFAMTYDNGEGLTGFLPINNPVEIQTAAHELANAVQSGAWPLPELHKAASAICDAADDRDMPVDGIHPDCLRLAGRWDVDFEKAALFLESRRDQVGDQEFEVYEGLLKSASTDYSLLPESVELMAELDELHGISYSERRHLDPYRAVYSGNQSLAEFEKFASSWVGLAGALVPVSALTAVDSDRIDANFDAEEAGIIKEAQALCESDSIKAEVGLDRLDYASKQQLLTLLIPSE